MPSFIDIEHLRSDTPNHSLFLFMTEIEIGQFILDGYEFSLEFWYHIHTIEWWCLRAHKYTHTRIQLRTYKRHERWRREKKFGKRGGCCECTRALSLFSTRTLVLRSSLLLYLVASIFSSAIFAFLFHGFRTRKISAGARLLPKMENISDQIFLGQEISHKWSIPGKYTK